VRFLANGQSLTFDQLENKDGLIEYDTAKQWLDSKSIKGTQYDFKGLSDICSIQ
jgi:hypothetical protein